jgi:hypothetical protein
MTSEGERIEARVHESFLLHVFLPPHFPTRNGANLAPRNVQMPRNTGGFAKLPRYFLDSKHFCPGYRLPDPKSWRISLYHIQAL